MNPAEWLVRSAERCGARPALMTGLELRADYARFAERAARIGAGLRAGLSIAPGDRVALFMTNRVEYLEALYGVWFAGAVAVPINAKLHPREAAFILEDAGAAVCVASDDVGDALAGAAPPGLRALLSVDRGDLDRLAAAEPLAAPTPTPPEAVVWLFYTSGTTGAPKGVEITAGNLQAMALAYCVDVDPVSAADATLYAAPMSHGAGLYALQHVLKGARHVAPPSGGFDPAEILDLAPRLERVSLFAAPTMVRRFVDAARGRERPGEGLRTIVYGGGPMYLADILEAVEVMGPRFAQIYGQGESPMTITTLSRETIADRTHPRWRERLGSVGLAHSPVAVRIADAEGRNLPRGAIGEILVSGATVMRGYWRNPEATAATLRGGWLWTGDKGAMDAEGFVTLHDRSKDVIITGGANVYPREVEEALLTHPAVREAAVVGRRHADWGEEVVAFVATAPGVEIRLEELDAACLARIARFKRPKAYRVVSELPKNNYGKVLKTELRRWLAEETPDALVAEEAEADADADSGGAGRC